MHVPLSTRVRTERDTDENKAVGKTRRPQPGCADFSIHHTPVGPGERQDKVVGSGEFDLPEKPNSL